MSLTPEQRKAMFAKRKARNELKMKRLVHFYGDRSRNMTLRECKRCGSPVMKADASGWKRCYNCEAVY